MDNLQPYKISLDFYIRKIITVNAKQLDSDSRIINITCTENGKKFFVDSSTTSAFVRYKKSDGHSVLNQINIISDGTVNLELSQQMLAVEGRHLVDIMLINKSELSIYTQDVVVEDDNEGNVTIIEKQTANVADLSVEEILERISQNGISVLSTMSFYINTEGITIEEGEIESSYEFNTLVDGLGKLVGVDERMSQLEITINNKETERQQNETTRQTEEKLRDIAENGEYDENGNLIKYGRVQKETQRIDAETSRIEAEKLRDIAENGEYDEDGNLIKEGRVHTTQKANEATIKANEAASKCQSVIDKSGIVLKSDIIHNLETEDENKVPDATQVKILKEMIASLQAQLDAVHKVYFDKVEPTSEIGKDGDIYMMLIQETETASTEAGE